MSDLYVSHSVEPTQASTYRKASRRDVLLWLGWEECDGLHFPADMPKPADFASEIAQGQGCDSCVDGLVPPARQVEAAADGIDALGFDTLELRNWGEGSVPGATELVARAALVEWAKTLEDT